MKKYRLIPVKRNKYTIFVIQIKFLYFFWIDYMEWNDYDQEWEKFEFSNQDNAIQKITDLRMIEYRKKDKKKKR